MTVIFTVLSMLNISKNFLVEVPLSTQEPNNLGRYSSLTTHQGRPIVFWTPSIFIFLFLFLNCSRKLYSNKNTESCQVEGNYFTSLTPRTVVLCSFAMGYFPEGQATFCCINGQLSIVFYVNFKNNNIHSLKILLQNQ